MDPLIFWLEQEPTINSEDNLVFLPADTPTDNTLNKYNYQLSKKGHVRKHRTVNRLRAYEMEKIAMRRRTPHARDARSRPLVKLEVIKGEEFLNTHKGELMELFKMTEKYQKGDKIVNTATYRDSKLCLEEWDHSYARGLQTKNAAVIEEHEKEFYRLRSEIYNNEVRDPGHHSHTASSSSSSTVPPHSPTMSGRDPRSSITDSRRPQQ
ncbi:bifunctional uridylate/adenylate kinase [Mucor velutinosus]|uniref:Bifunctional uridylate/adenylate kinase n=1 Tax=Mucor velutinosus TaxID=708070 RepID=A0AAN7HNA2_9FUNG|nr:bifunctional uridylate/adenylate kinase [Mucor velutinosus]